MEFAETVRRRRMVRAYDADRPVPDDALRAALDAARRAPSAGFTQGVSFLVLGTAAGRERFWQATASESPTPGGDGSRWLRGMRTAPVLVLVWTSREAYLDRYAEPDKGWTDRDPERWSAPYWFVDAGMAAMAALLTAVDHGLGACFFGVPADRVDQVRRAFGVPAEQLAVGVISLGYPAGRGTAGSPARRPRRPAEEVIHHEQW